MDVGRLDAVFVLQDAAHPYDGGDLVFRKADGLADEVPRRLDAAVGADIDAGMAEDARDESGYADVRGFAGIGDSQIGAEGELADVELLVAEGAEKHLLGLERDVGDVAALHRHAAVLQRAGAVIIAAGDGDRDLNGHRLFLSCSICMWARKNTSGWMPTASICPWSSAASACSSSRASPAAAA